MTFRRGERPVGRFDDASELYPADKSTYGAGRVRRRFTRDWVTH